jgi:choline kinase
VIFDSDNRVIKIGKIGASGVEVHGEFIGMMKLTGRGCDILRSHYERAKSIFDNRPFQRAKVFRQAYLTDLLQDMADLGVPIHCEIIGSKWKEIDTIEDFRKAEESLKQSKRSARTKPEREARGGDEHGNHRT